MSKPVEFYWWDGSDLLALFAKISEVGAANVRMRFYPPDSKHKARAGKIYLLPKTDDLTIQGHDDGDGGYNVVHTCPPDCGPD